MGKKEYTIVGKTKKELANNVESLFGWKKRRICKYYIKFTNFERIYYFKNEKYYYARIRTTITEYQKALELGIVE